MHLRGLSASSTRNQVPAVQQPSLLAWSHADEFRTWGRCQSFLNQRWGLTASEPPAKNLDFRFGYPRQEPPRGDTERVIGGRCTGPVRSLDSRRLDEPTTLTLPGNSYAVLFWVWPVFLLGTIMYAPKRNCTGDKKLFANGRWTMSYTARSAWDSPSSAVCLHEFLTSRPQTLSPGLLPKENREI